MANEFRVVASEDIPEAALDRLAAEWAAIGTFSTPERILMRSAEPPTIVQVVGGLLAWTTPLKLAAAAFTTSIGKHAGDDLWKNKAAIGKAIKLQSTQILYNASGALVNVGSSIPRPIQLAVGLNFPDPHFGSTFSLTPGSREDAAAKIAALVLKAERIQDLLADHEAKGAGPIGPVRLELEGSGDVEITWLGLDHKSYSFTV
jgi:hypothetical protein